MVESKDEFGSVWPEALQGGRETSREIPKITRLDVLHRCASQLVEDGDAAVAVRHDRPFSLLVPVHFTNAAGGQAHVHAGNRRRDLEIRLRDLAGPAAVLDALGGDVERVPEHRHAADIRSEGPPSSIQAMW